MKLRSTRTGYRTWAIPALGLLAVAAGSVVAWAQGAPPAAEAPPAPARTLYNPAPETGNEFGHPVAFYGDDLLVAMAKDDGGVQQRGTVLQLDTRSGALIRTFARPEKAAAATAVPVRKKQMPDEPVNSAVVSLLNVEDKVLVGMPYDDVGKQKFAGAVHVFNSHDGRLLRSLVVPGKAKGKPGALPVLEARDSRIGSAIAMIDGHVLAGAPGVALRKRAEGPPVTVARAGVVFEFDLESGNVLNVLQKPDPASDDAFGTTLAVARGLILVGAPGEQGGGAVHAYNGGGGGVVVRSYKRAEGLATDGFATALAATDHLVLVGAPGDGHAGRHSGAVYVFDAARATLLRVLKSPTAAADDLFGYSVAAAGEGRIVIGAHGIDKGAGAVLVLDSATGTLLQMLKPPRSVPDAGFGMSVAVAGDRVAVSAHREPMGEVGTGVVYLLALPAGRAASKPTAAAEPAKVQP